MKTDQVRCMIMFALFWLLVTTAGSQAKEPAPASIESVDTTVTVEFRDTTVSPFDQFYTMAIYITTPVAPLAGLNVRLVANRPDLVELPDSAVFYPILNKTGSAILGWDYVNENKITPQVLNVAALYNLPGGTTPAPLPASASPYRICKFTMRRIPTLAMLDTLQDRTMTWSVALANCSFSTPQGQPIGIRDTTYCLNPPICDSLQAGHYDANTYISGTLTIAPSCGARGDVNVNGTINSSDVIFLVNYVFKAGPPPGCSGASGDVNCTGSVNSSDIIALVNYVFKGGPPPC